MNVIIDALQYAVKQTTDSAGDIQAFCTDAEMTCEDNISMAEVASDLAAIFTEIFKNGSIDFIIDVNDCSASLA